jgi:hypothetical protein
VATAAEIAGATEVEILMCFVANLFLQSKKERKSRFSPSNLGREQANTPDEKNHFVHSNLPLLKALLAGKKTSLDTCLFFGANLTVSGNLWFQMTSIASKLLCMATSIKLVRCNYKGK